MTQSVYVISSALGPCKIGMSNNAHNRLGTLLTSSAVPLRLEFSGKCEAAKKIEKRTHKMLGASRIRGEWFSITTAEAIAAIMAAAKDLGYQIVPTEIHRKPVVPAVTVEPKKRVPRSYRRMSPTATTRAKISAALKGRPHEESRRAKMSASRLAYIERIRVDT